MTPVLRAVFALMLLLQVGGCIGVAAVAGAEATSDMVFGRGIADIGVSAVTGRDCSTVRLDKGLPYCAPRDAGPVVMPYCTRTLGTVMCWKDPEKFVVLPPQVADTPSPTAEQAKLAAARWPKSLNVEIER
jgi:hypothetical protein